MTSFLPSLPSTAQASAPSQSADVGVSRAPDPDQQTVGFFGSLFDRFASATQPGTTPETDEDSNLELAAISTSDTRSPFDLFGNVFQPFDVSAPASQPRPEQGPVAFGDLRENCAVGGAALGTRVMSQSGFEIYDSAPGSTQPRAHYIKGFDDRCAREFVGSLVFFGDVGTHEVVRYSETRIDLEYSATDTAYEAIKARFCGARQGAPCGGQLERLGRQTTFVTVYETFGSSAEWAEFLLHDGSVAGVAIESP